MDNLLPPAHLAAPAAPGQLDLAIAAWLDAKRGRSGSERTHRAYHDTLTQFRAALHNAHLDLDGDVQAVALAAQAWCGHSSPAPSSFNQRRAILSSFYVYATGVGLLSTNPITRVARRSVDEYAAARPLDLADIRERLGQIDRTIPSGKRDYVLLAIYLQTGRRLVEVAGLEWRDVQLAGDRVTLTFRRCKGGKVMRDSLPGGVSKALLIWLQAAYNDLRQLQPDSPLWLNLATNGQRSQLGTDGIRDICVSRLGISKVHALRHTFAKTMESAGAKVSDIQARLGHSSLATTGRYLAALKRAENDQADDLAALFGLD